MKLKDNFFDTDEMIVLESMLDGYRYSNILLKLYLRSLRNEGKLMFNDRIPYNSTILSQVTRHSVGDVEKAISIFKQLNLIEVLDNGAIYITDIQNFIGTSSTEADRKREYRSRIEQEKVGLLPEKIDTQGVLSVVDKCPDKTPPEIEIELELEREKEKELEKKNSPAKAEPSLPYSEVVDYLNEKTKSKFRSSSQATQRLIKARFNDGFTLNDFKQVIDTKSDEWLRDKKMSIYLRPETLFSNKFEGYLNQKRQTFSNLSDMPDIPDTDELPF